MLKRIAILILAGLALPVIAAFAAGGTEAPAAAAASDKISPTPIAYTWLIPDHPDAPLVEPNPLFDYWKEKTNVEIKFQKIPQASYNEKYIIIQASGDIPDISRPLEWHVYGPRGMYANLKPLIEQHAPNAKPLILSDKVYPTIASPDGNLYMLPTINHVTSYRLKYAWQYRKDLTDKLGLKEPTTPEEWYAAFVAIKKAYPDMIPFSTPNEEWRWKASNTPLYSATDLFYFPAEDRYEYSPVSPRTREAVAWYARLYAEGLFDKEYFTVTKKDLDQKIVTGKLFAWPDQWWSNAVRYTEVLQGNGFKDGLITSAVPLKSHWGPQIMETSEYARLDDRQCAISARIKKPEIAMKFLDYIGFSKEGSATAQFGVPDLHWKWYDTGPDYTDETLARLLKGESISTGAGWHQRIAHVQIQYYYPDASRKYNASLKDSWRGTFQKQLEDKLAPFMSYTMPPVAAYFETKERERVKEILDVLNPLWYEAKLQFIIGRRPMSQWDAYVANMKKYNCDELESLYNTAYDRYKKASGKK